jgi:hypothetical protein
MVQVKDIPYPVRWRMATHVLTRMVVALGEETRYSAEVPTFQKKMFSEIGDEIRAIADRYGMPRNHAADLVQTLGAVSVILFGPEFETRYIEGDPREGAIRLTECAMFRNESSYGVSPSQVHRACMAYIQNAVEALNPAFSISAPLTRCRGDSFCEMVIEQKRG